MPKRAATVTLLVPLLLLTLVLCQATTAGAATLWVGENIDVHNNTGQVAHDFHMQGIIKSVTAPTLGFAIGYVDGAPFPNFNYSITPVGGDVWRFSATWSSQDVQPSQVGHFGLFFNVWSRNVLIDKTGWWTDRAGNPIGNWPMLGFEVPKDWWSPPNEQVFRLQAGNVPVELLQMDLLRMNPPADPTQLFSLLNARDMNQISGWTGVRDMPKGEMAADSFFDVFTELVIGPMQPDQLLIARVNARWPSEPAGRWFFEVHQAHPVPEPSAAALIGAGLVGLLSLAAARRMSKRK